MERLIARQRGGGGGEGTSSAVASAASTVRGAMASATSNARAAASAAATSAAAGNTQPGGGGNKSNKAAKKALVERSIYIQWWVITGVVFACFCCYAFAVARAFLIRRRIAAARRAGQTSSAPASKKNATQFSRLPAALNATFQNIAYVRVFPIWIFTHNTAAELWWNIAYMGILLGVSFWGQIFDGKLDYANPMGYIAFAHMPLVIGLASKNNVISYITGVSYEKLNYLHRAAGRMCILTTWLHTLGWFHKGLGRHGPGTVIFLSGMLGSVACLIMWLTSFALLRRVMYETFLLIHIMMSIIFLVGSYYHWPRLKVWIWVSLFLWGLDRFVSGVRMLVVNKAWLMPFKSRHTEHSGSVVELVDPNVIRLTVNRPLLRWNAGQHAFITMPGVARLRYEQHPLTIANVPEDDGKVTFIIRAQSGFTRRLVNRINKDIVDDINCYIDGPYGVGHDFNHFDSVLLVAGGTGISFASAQLLSVLKASREGKSAVSHVRLVWNVREAVNTNWVAPLINEALAKGAGNVPISIDIYITRSAASAEPNNVHARQMDDHPDGSDSPANSSPSGSSENMHEKSSSTSSAHGHDEKHAAIAGFSPQVAQFVTFHHGRSHLETILRDDVSTSTTDAGGVGVAVCGPTALALDTRRAVCKVNTASAILRGQNQIELFTENFGW